MSAGVQLFFSDFGSMKAFFEDFPDVASRVRSYLGFLRSSGLKTPRTLLTIHSNVLRLASLGSMMAFSKGRVTLNTA